MRGRDHDVGEVTAAADDDVGILRLVEHHRIERLPADDRIGLAFFQQRRELGLAAVADVDDLDVLVFQVAPREHHFQVLVRSLAFRQPDALAFQVLDVARTDAGILARDDRERLVGIGARRIALDDADHAERIAAVARLQERRDAHVADLHLVLLHRGHHLRTDVDDFQLDLDAVFPEEAFFDADEHRQMAEVVADHRFHDRQCLRRRAAGRAERGQSEQHGA